MTRHPLVEEAVTAYLAGLSAVDGTKLAKAKVRTGALDDWFEDRYEPRPIHVLALGKAAPAMMWGLVEANVPFTGLGVVPPGRTKPARDGFEWLVGEHPVPGPDSFAAGRRIDAWLQGLPEDAPLLVLLSGGASSICEQATDDDQEALRAAWVEDMEAGLDIVTANQRRAGRSNLKGGGMARIARTRTERIRVWCISDVPPGTERKTLGSGPFDDDAVAHDVLADNETMLAGTAQALSQGGRQVYRSPERLAGRTTDAIDRFFAMADQIDGDSWALVAGGEPTDAVPADSPPGGRCAHAALAAARPMAGREGLFVAAASDGEDGRSRDAGAWSDGATWSDEAQPALASWNAHAFLAARGQTVRTGPTATNVNDAWILLGPGLK